LTFALLALIAAPALADPASPQAAPQIGALRAGVFCALQTMDQMPAPGTASGWVHVPSGDITFHWPDRQVVPASIGLAFGVRATGAPGFSTSDRAEVRVTRPGGKVTDRWSSGVSDAGASVVFFRFDTFDELVTGLWAIEGWDGETLLYRVEFEVVPAAALPEITNACGAIS
jgi:hypothetical protein